MKHVLYSEEYIYYLQLKRYKCLSKLGRVLMLWSKGILPPTDIHELLRCYATFAILKTFGFADFPWKSLHPHVFAGPKLKNLIVQARTAFGALDPSIIYIILFLFLQIQTIFLQLYFKILYKSHFLTVRRWSHSRYF